ncbi:C2H2-type zinc finger protein [Halosolutus amylolyticus]|uniref:C2H2-type zinc finger protein n=1 Tax=Halosolutus amylolyticus TaxID=2932267 RepID=A0ABD5PPD9_9EURY|nr:C2H2-type zinc finger protein [Halosolutus amylolyticus]
MTVLDGERLPMNDYKCPLCTDTYGEQTNLQVHLEVEHRKSEIVSSLIDALDAGTESGVENEQRPTPPV